MARRNLVGRASELDALRQSVAHATQGRGALWFVCGEAGIGKSRLVDELVKQVPKEVRVLWGRCWEAGGASAFWPWIQLLRDLLDRQQTERLSSYLSAQLAQLLPELHALRPNLPELPRLAPEQARFELLDAVARVLCDAAHQETLLLILEDLHAADPSTLLLLDFVGRQLHMAPLVVVGTYRDAEAAGRTSGPSLSRISQHGRTFHLRRLNVDEVTRVLCDELGTEVGPDLAAEVHRTTDGNPLFLVELARLLGHDRSEAEVLSAAQGRLLPLGIRMAIDQRLEKLSGPAREALAMAAVVGRDFRSDRMALAFRLDPDGLREALSEGVQSTLLTREALDCYRYSHILVREVIYQGIDAGRREALHLQLADEIRQACEKEAAPRWAEAAHHYFAAGPAGLEGAVETSERAAEQALARHAYDEAIATYQRVIAALEQVPGMDAGRHVDALIGLGRAQLAHGESEAGQSACVRAASLARSRNLSMRFSEAALAYGSVFVFARVDETLVALLEEALERLGHDDSPQRARVMARLAAAQQPAHDPEGPVLLARQAIDMARRVGDRGTLLATLRSGCSSMMDLVRPEIRRPFNEEHVALAESLGDRPEVFRGAARLALDCIELGDRAGTREAVARLERVSAALGHPHFQWRVKAFEAAASLWRGQLADAERLVDEALELGTRGRDPNAPHAALFLRARLYSLQGRTGELSAIIPRLARMFDGTPEAEPLARIYAQGFRLEARLPSTILPATRPDEVETALRLRDPSALPGLTRIAVAEHDVVLGQRVYDRLAEQAEQLVTGGLLGMTWDGPRRWSMALLADMLGEGENAERLFAAAATQARALGGEAVWACIGADHLESQARHGGADPRLVEEVREACEKTALRGVLDRLPRPTVLAGGADAIPPVARIGSDIPAPLSWSLRNEGDYWMVCCGDSTFRLRDIKGLQMLATLVDSPGRPFHVLDLAYPHREVMDADGGTLIDDVARADYERRVRSLQEDLADAEARNDLGRMECAREELEFLGQQLAGAIGLGGRHRKAKDSAERARVNVQRRLRDAIRRIESKHKLLGQHLVRHVRTGTFCHYD